MSVRAVVIGGGLDELVAAHLLRRAGYAVTLLSSEEIPGWESGWLPPRIARALGLEKHGLRIDAPDPWAVAPLPQGGRLELSRDMARSVEAIRRVSPRDAAKWPRFCQRMARLSRFLQAFYLGPPPDPLGLRFALRARLLGGEGLVDLMRLLPMPVAELLDDGFESDALKGLLGALALAQLQQGPRSGGTAFRLLHAAVGSPPGVFRPPRSNAAALLGKLPGPQRRRIGVREIRVKDGRAVGVVAADGEELEASVVLSGEPPQRTLLELVDTAWLDPQLVRAVRHIRRRGVVAQATLALDRPPGFRTLIVAPSLDYLERAYDDSKYARASREPWLDARWDGHALQVDVQYVPHGVETSALGDVLAAMLSEHLGDAGISAAPAVTLQDAPQAELTLDQALWMRPLPELAHYRTPIEGLWLCGSAMHPGPGIAGAAGYNCAREALRR